MLETELKKLTAALEANTTALLGGGAPDVVVAKDAGNASPTPVVVDIPPAPVAVDTPAPAAANLKMITEGIVALAKAKGREAAATLLAEYGAARVPDLKKVSDKYDEIFAKITALTEAK